MISTDRLCEEKIQGALTGRASAVRIECRNEVTSTNSILKEPSYDRECALIALSQTAGRGRLGRSFFSPHDSGLYLSLRFKPSVPLDKYILLTPAAAVAACHAIESVSGKSPQIKWVNDLISDNRKICGILTEIITSPNISANVIVGIGINVYSPQGGFPDELSTIAGHIFDEPRENLRNNLAAAFINSFLELCDNIDSSSFIDEYRKRSCVIGRRINVIRADTVRSALALDIDSECRLMVQYDDGTKEALQSGEISIRAI